MPGAAQPWDQSEDPRDQTVDLPRIDLASFGNGHAPDPGSGGITRPSSYPPDLRRSGTAAQVPAEPPLAPLPPPRREPPGRPGRSVPREPLPRRLPDASRDPYARPGHLTQPGALFRPPEPDDDRRRDIGLLQPAAEPDDRGPFQPAAPADSGRAPDNGARGHDNGRVEAARDADREPVSPPSAASAVDAPLATSLAAPPVTALPVTAPPVPALPVTAPPVTAPPPVPVELPLPATPMVSAEPSHAPAAAAPDPPAPDSGAGADLRHLAQTPAPPSAAAARRRTAPARPVGRPAPGSIRDLLGRLDRLPDGHPSSPYEDGGLAKPLPRRLRQLELGLPAPDRELADRAALTDFAVAAARSTDRPAAELPPAAATEPPRPESAPPAPRTGENDRADAGPDPYAVAAANGHGDSGHGQPDDRELALRPWQSARAEPNGSNGHARASDDREQLVAGLLAACRAAEGRNKFGEYGASGLTPAMRRIAHQLPRGGLAPDSEADTLKPPERLAAKLARLIARHPGRSPEELAAGIGDGVRYAFSFDPDYYTEGTWLVHRKLKAYGFELEARRNRWDSPEYKGVWTRWRDPAHGLAFEVQFHTGQSWDVLQRTHAAYVQITDPGTPAAERARLRARQVAAAASARAPANCMEIVDFGREAR